MFSKKKYYLSVTASEWVSKYFNKARLTKNWVLGISTNFQPYTQLTSNNKVLQMDIYIKLSLLLLLLLLLCNPFNGTIPPLSHKTEGALGAPESLVLNNSKKFYSPLCSPPPTFFTQVKGWKEKIYLYLIKFLFVDSRKVDLWSIINFNCMHLVGCSNL